MYWSEVTLQVGGDQIGCDINWSEEVTTSFSSTFAQGGRGGGEREGVKFNTRPPGMRHFKYVYLCEDTKNLVSLEEANLISAFYFNCIFKFLF